MNPADALKELFDLLEIYAPAWFTEDQRLRVVRALGGSSDPVAEVSGASPESCDLPSASLSCRKQLRAGTRHLSVIPASQSGGPAGGTQTH